MVLPQLSSLFLSLATTLAKQQGWYENESSLFKSVGVCRWLVRISPLLYRYMLEIPYIKFIHMLINLSKMYNKILCLVFGSIRNRLESCFFLIRGVNQQVTLLFCNNGTSETACDITFQFNNYLNLKPLHKS